MKTFKRTLYFLLSLALFYYVLNYVQAPSSWPQASNFQILSFFIPLLISYTFFINIFLNNLLRSFALGLGLFALTVLKALNLFNLITAPLALALALMLFIRLPKKGLTFRKKIPKLNLHTEEKPKRREKNG